MDNCAEGLLLGTAVGGDAGGFDSGDGGIYGLSGIGPLGEPAWEELSRRIARSRSQISNTLRLMKLPPLVQRRLAANVISAGHARALLGLPNAAEMERLAQRVVAEGLSVRATEELVALHEEPEPGSDQPKVLRARSTPLPALSTRLSDAFDTRVKVTRGAKKGRITIEFAGDEDLARLVDALAPGTSLDEE